MFISLVEYVTVISTMQLQMVAVFFSWHQRSSVIGHSQKIGKVVSSTFRHRLQAGLSAKFISNSRFE